VREEEDNSYGHEQWMPVEEGVGIHATSQHVDNQPGDNHLHRHAQQAQAPSDDLLEPGEPLLMHVAAHKTL
jgi:hypothetical protein